MQVRLFAKTIQERMYSPGVFKIIRQKEDNGEGDKSVIYIREIGDGEYEGAKWESEKEGYVRMDPAEAKEQYESPATANFPFREGIIEFGLTLSDFIYDEEKHSYSYYHEGDKTKYITLYFENKKIVRVASSNDNEQEIFTYHKEKIEFPEIQ